MAKNEKEEKKEKEEREGCSSQAGTALDPAELLDPTSDTNFLHHITTSPHPCITPINRVDLELKTAQADRAAGRITPEPGRCYPSTYIPAIL